MSAYNVTYREYNKIDVSITHMPPHNVGKTHQASFFDKLNMACAQAPAINYI